MPKAKLLLFSDLHNNVTAAQTLVEQSHTVDVVVGAGDFGYERWGLEIAFDILKAINRPAILVPGNCESEQELVEACRSWPQAQVLHGSGTTVNGVEFYGLGGGIPVTPFGSWSHDYTETQAAELLANCPTGGVIVTHSPPKGVVDISSRGQSLGSVAIRETIKERKPALVVCGHIHGSAGQRARLGNTVVINAGPYGLVWETA